MNVSEEVLTRIDALVDALSQKMGIAADHFWPIFIRQQVTSSATYIAVWTLFSFLLFYVGHRFRATIRERPYKHSDRSYVSANEMGDVRWVGVLVPTIIGTGVMVVCLSVNLPPILNPEFYAIRSLIRML